MSANVFFGWKADHGPPRLKVIVGLGRKLFVPLRYL